MRKNMIALRRKNDHYPTDKMARVNVFGWLIAW
jgi:hypothetical protein